LLLLGSLACTEALRRTSPAGIAGRNARFAYKAVAFFGIVYAALVITPKSLLEVARFDGRNQEFGQALQKDLTTLGGKQLDHKVQCLDMAGGCIDALFKLRLVQGTGFLYDCYLYPYPTPSAHFLAERERYRMAFRQAMTASPPEILIVTSDECGPPDFEYHKLHRWPWLNSYLADHYRKVRDWVPERLQRWGGKPALPYGYRIYQLEQ
jgi:hypothetical protein